MDPSAEYTEKRRVCPRALLKRYAPSALASCVMTSAAVNTAPPTSRSDDAIRSSPFGVGKSCVTPPSTSRNTCPPSVGVALCVDNDVTGTDDDDDEEEDDIDVVDDDNASVGVGVPKGVDV